MRPCALPRAAAQRDHTELYKNLGDESFQDVTRRWDLDKVFMAMGANFGDFDNDGFLDIYIGTGTPSYAALVPNVLLRNGCRIIRRCDCLLGYRRTAQRPWRRIRKPGQ